MVLSLVPGPLAPGVHVNFMYVRTYVAWSLPDHSVVCLFLSAESASGLLEWSLMLFRGLEASQNRDRLRGQAPAVAMPPRAGCGGQA